MALYQRRESVGRTRFLLALSLSTLTAIAVAAPLAIQAIRAEESTFAVGDPSTGQRAEEPDDALLSSPGNSRSINTDQRGMGGIGARPPAKGLGQTTKPDNEPVDEPSAPAEESVLTNPAEEPPPSSEPGPATKPATQQTTSTTTPAEPETTAVSTTEPASTSSSTEGPTTTIEVVEPTNTSADPDTPPVTPTGSASANQSTTSVAAPPAGS